MRIGIDIDNCISNFDDTLLKEYLKQNHEIEIDSDKKLIIKSFNLNYNPDSKVVRNYSIRGYLLEK